MLAHTLGEVTAQEQVDAKTSIGIDDRTVTGGNLEVRSCQNWRCSKAPWKKVQKWESPLCTFQAIIPRSVRIASKG